MSDYCYLPETIELGVKALGSLPATASLAFQVTAVLDAVGYSDLVTEKELRQAAETDGFPPHKLRVVRAGYLDEMKPKKCVHAEAINGYGQFND